VRTLSENEATRASARAFNDLIATEQAPTLSTMMRARDLVVANRVNHDPRSALVYDVAGGAPYVVVLRLDEHGRVRREISLCTCEAGRAKRTCYHLVGALIDAYDQGFELSRVV
jgi:hypothetical protein